MWWNTDTVIVHLYHINKEWYDFLITVRKAKAGSSGPFVEPVNVISNVEGGLGIFTTLNSDFDSIRITP